MAHILCNRCLYADCCDSTRKLYCTHFLDWDEDNWEESPSEEIATRKEYYNAYVSYLKDWN